MEQNRFFPEIKGNFGFGCMRLPMKDGEIDLAQVCEMADRFIDAGFNYFDTAHGYHGGKSELAIRECVSKRHKRSDFLLTDKLTDPYFNSQAEIRPFFESQLASCGVDYFDFYPMHAQNARNYQKFKQCSAYETAYRLKEEGLIRHFGISFHDKPQVFDMILTEHPEIEAVQIQFNYADYNDSAVESRAQYEICEKHNKPVIIMEPVKGGSLVNLTPEADKIFRSLNGGSNASYALRFAGSFEKVAMILSGMSDVDQMEDNISSMRDFKALDAEEMNAVSRVCGIFKGLNMIPCTTCRYCVTDNSCPQDILIPDLFSALNTFEVFKNWNTRFLYKTVLTSGGHGKASDCIQCGMCESVCPQKLEIRRYLEQVAETFEKKN